jgi:phage gp29-like protein
MAQIVDVYGRPLQRETLKTEQTVKVADRLRIYPDHPSRGLNIRKLPRILQAAEQGSLSAQACLFGDMEERDGHLFAEMEKRRNALLTLDWSIEPPRNASAEELKLTAAIDDWLRGIPNMEDVVLNGMSAVGYGFSCQEIAWELTDKVWLPSSINLRPHYWFNTLPDQGDEIRLDDGSYQDGKSGSELWPFGWLVHRHNARSGFVGSSGLYRVLVWPYLFKNFALRDLAEFLEIYGLPARIAYYAQGTSDEDRDKILEALVHLGHEAVAAIPQGNEIKFEEAASGGADAFMAMIDWAERTTSKAILGSTLTSQADGKSSTNALGNVHNEVRHDLMTADARQIEGMFSSLIQMLAALNGYSDIHPRRLPRLVFDTQEETDISDWADAIATLVNEVRLPNIPTAWVRKKAGIPTPKDGEEVLALPQLPTGGGTASLSRIRQQLRLAALSNQTTEDDDPTQLAIDRAELPADDINQGMAELLAPLVQALQQGQSADEAMNILAEAWPTLPDAELRQLLEQAIFVGDIWGRLNADS